MKGYEEGSYAPEREVFRCFEMSWTVSGYDAYCVSGFAPRFITTRYSAQDWLLASLQDAGDSLQALCLIVKECSLATSTAYLLSKTSC